MEWATIDKERHDAMVSITRRFIALENERDTGIPAGIAGTVAPRINPKEVNPE